ncbi:MAG: HAMP domain-containing histidine kinase [Cytophagales bacterium]|jgi:signal transduction histidine kinase|nr:HAMP domain-containing histidine kinase [Cytophagales bacterium]
MSNREWQASWGTQRWRGLLVALGLVLLGLLLMLALGFAGGFNHSLDVFIWYFIKAALVALGLGALGVFWLRRGWGPLWLQMLLTYVLGIGIALFITFQTAQLMIVDSSQLPQLVLLLLFTGVVSAGLGFGLSHTLVQRVKGLHQGAQALASGDLTTRVPTDGRDELAGLAQEFNRMAAQLATSADERARQEAARRELMVAVSHDLRTPLAALQAMVEAMADGVVDDPATATRYAATMRGQIEVLRRLIDDLFELSRIDAGALTLNQQRVSLHDLVGETLMGLQPHARARGVTLTGQVATVGPALGDPQQLARVLHNLIGNAIRHTPAGGQVCIDVSEAIEEPDGHAAQPADQSCMLQVTIADTGEGIAPEDIPHVFERFYRGEKSRSRATGGAGLGLAIARGIVEAHGGSIWLTSKLGQGTQVSFTLQRAV